ncbi:ImmA/IrrE family metallo-endopeptidase [Staphylococcus simulans]
MVNRVSINTTVLNAYINESSVPLSAIKKKVKKIENIMSGEIQPTFNQLVTIANTIHVPAGMLVLNEKINLPKEKLEFRVINSDDMEPKSEELKATIQEMRMKQAFLKEEIEYELPFIHRFTEKDDYLEVAEEIRKVLEIPIAYMKDAKPDAFNYFRMKLNRVGIFVFLNGKVKDNTHRQLNIKEFRGFVLSDIQAPIIFINQTDTKNGRLFTLIHELVHLFVGHDGIFNDDAMLFENKSSEAYVNKITAEILVPKSELDKMTSNDIEILGSIFPVSPYVLYRRLYDEKRISYQVYQSQIHKLNEAFEAYRNKQKKKSTSGNYNHNLNYRMDHVFFNYVDNALKQNRISYTDAFQLVGVGYKGYKLLEGTR